LLVVTPNLCFDRTLRVDRFEAGSIARPYEVLETAGGKGVNVCRTVGDLGGRADLVGVVGSDDVARLNSEVRAEGLSLHAVEVAGRLRVATIIVEDSGRASVLNEPGPIVTAEVTEALCRRVAELLPDRSVLLVCSGSLPPGMDTDVYGRLAVMARAQGVVSVIDGARAALADSLAFEPDLVTPNLHEAEGVVEGRSEEASHDDAPLDEVRDRAFAMAATLRDRGARRALVTAGAHGAAYAADDGDVWVAAPPVQVRNPIGAGDALVGGLAQALTEGQDWIDAVRWGVAVASAAVEHPAAGHLDVAEARRLAGTQVTAP
jgi:1-phosphofructokinase family hexose kinase